MYTLLYEVDYGEAPERMVGGKGPGFESDVHLLSDDEGGHGCAGGVVYKVVSDHPSLVPTQWLQIGTHKIEV